MLVLTAYKKDHTVEVREIASMTVDRTTGIMWYLPLGTGKTLLQLHPDSVSEAYVRNDAGSTVFSHDFQPARFGPCITIT